ncbi:MAG TPA: type II secretion system protein GspM [Smithellaceae bacterium]|jgi:general secretion pathway protein M|nr:type II secretion system protein M [Syntrophaceae bacterium]HOE78804.1 type II secretion system protein GspM [Smithellaceae bacterium]HPV48275.1 type II secretion system protein GspM [Smithellaceae bacterium]HQF84174.1 type II secretion system protein GspM [Smithellaceae bacterium]HQG79956.1 type II secretion system protein GspM [Smithellaceae bacterium]
MIKSYWNSLDRRQRYVAGLGIVFVVAVLIWAFVLSPLWEAKAKMKKSISSNSGKLAEMISMDEAFADQEAQISRIKTVLASRRDFTLFSYLEKKAVAARVKGSIRQMNSMQGTKSSSFEESLIDLKLDRLTIRQLVEFLYQVESPDEMIRIKRITIDKMKENPEYISVQILVASYTPVESSAGGM